MVSQSRIEGFGEAEKYFEDLISNKKLAVTAVSKAAPYLLEETKKSVHQAIHNPASSRKGDTYSTGALERSFEMGKAKDNQWGAFCSVGPVGTDRTKTKPIHYAARAAFLEWGTKRGQAPSPWRARAVKNAQEKCEKAMEETFLKEVDKVWKVEEYDDT